jgi:aspartate aminotransferase-like enzyme
MSEYFYKIADQPAEFEQIHRLNYRTFVDEIPQHPSNPEGVLVDRFHAENTYAICLAEGQLLGMVAGRGQRPFSLDGKLADLDHGLPPHQRPIEIRLLAVQPAHRKTEVFVRLMATLALHFGQAEYDLAVISATLRQTRLYHHLGFVPFGPRVGSTAAPYQPMYLDLATFNRLAAKLLVLSPPAIPMNLLTGPVAVSAEVEAAFKAPAISHRGATFDQLYQATRQTLRALTGTASAFLLLGSGTLANEAVAAQLSQRSGRGLVLANGEFGQRLLDHARRWRLDFTPLRWSWGEAVDVSEIASRLQADSAIRWIWMVSCETSTGMLNPVEKLARLCAEKQVALCLDAISAFGAVPQRFDGVDMVTAVSGKAVGALPGIGIVLANGAVCPGGTLPRYLDLAMYAGGTPFTHSSNLIAALHAALQAGLGEDRFDRIRQAAHRLRSRLRQEGFNILLDDASTSPAVTTLALPASIPVARLARQLSRSGYEVAAHSGYLVERNWLQIGLMGRFDIAALTHLPAVMAMLATRIQPGWQRSSRDVAALPANAPTGMA